jgi:OOP family OmpA-OmpF porin
VKFSKACGTLIAMGITAVASMAVVADDSGWYVGGNVGESRATIDEAKIVDGLKDSGFTTTSITDDDRHFGFKVFGGYQFDRFLAVEGGYFDLGQFGFTADTLPAGSYRGNIKLDGANLDLVGTLPFTDRFGAFARVGVEYAYARDSFAGSGMVVVPVSGRWEQATNAKFGFGLQYAFTPSLAMRLEAERYRIDDPVEHGADMDLYSIGLLYRFGARARAPRNRGGVCATATATATAAATAAARGTGAGSRGGARADPGAQPAVLQHPGHSVRHQPL